MMNQTVKSAEKLTNGAAGNAMGVAMDAAVQLRDGLTETAEGAIVAVKSEVDHLSRATREVASLVGAEVAKRPLTYTLAAAGAGALVGLGLMAIFGRSRNASR